MRGVELDMGVVCAIYGDFVNFGLDISTDVGDGIIVEGAIGIFKEKPHEISQLHLSKEKRAFADIGIIGELFADFGNFDSECMVNPTMTVLILEEEGR